MADSMGALFTSQTVTVKLLVALKGGTPLSVTRIAMSLVPGPCVSSGTQVSTPVLVFRFTPVGAATRLKRSVLAGRSGSVARFVTVRVVNSSTVCGGGTVSVGTRFTSFTTTVNCCVALRPGVPVSVTSTVITLVDGPCASEGVQANRPELVWIAAPAGGLSSA
ncbi:MAG: hypothetical protein MUE94_00340 [Verrucomicrobia bacterium]|nr:hypothetical protein [Verrucomicrobiota bacterium]